MARSEKIKKLLDGFIRGKLTPEESSELYDLINKEDISEQVKTWLYIYWDESVNRSTGFHSAGILEKIRSKLNMQKDFRKEEKEFADYILKKKSSGSSTFVQHFLRYAAVFLVAALTTFFLFNYSRFFNNNDNDLYSEITVSYGSKSSISLPDGSVVWLNSGSFIRYPKDFPDQVRGVYLEGEAFFNVESDPVNPFFVRTSDLNIRVTGTKFNVKSFPDEDYIETTLVTGEITIEKRGVDERNRKRISLQPNHIAVYNKSTSKLSITDLSLKQEELTGKPIKVDIKPLPSKKSEMLTAWKDNKLIFYNEKFDRLASRLERWYNVDIVLDKELVDLRFTGTFDGETIEQAMDALKLAAKLDYRIDKNKVIIRKSVD